MLKVSKAGCFSTFEFEQYYNETYGDKWLLTLIWANLYNAQQT
jgi:hypothetical protein